MLPATLNKAHESKGQRRANCVTWPKIGKGRNRQFFKNKSDADTFLEQKLIEQENFGTAGLAFDEKQRAEYLECRDQLRPFNMTLRDAVNFYLPYLQATNRTCTAAQLADEPCSCRDAHGKDRLSAKNDPSLPPTDASAIKASRWTCW